MNKMKNSFNHFIVYNYIYNNKLKFQFTTAKLSDT